MGHIDIGYTILFQDRPESSDALYKKSGAN